jgi:hypothetical protein
MSGSENGSLLMISDIEGCLQTAKITLQDNTIYDISQNTSLCRFDTFKGPLLNFLLDNDKNEIAFLGDYFDKGPGVVDSIIGIAYLHDYLDKQNKNKVQDQVQNRVHIILGNRDINKFRIAYELDMKKEERKLNIEGWKAWSDLYNTNNISDYFDQDGNVKKDEQLKLFHFITSKSMGGMSLPTDKIIHSSLSEEESLDWLYAVFTDSDILVGYKPKFDIVFNDTNKDEYKKLFVYSCRYLYQNATIVKKIDRFKVLLSHAGGFNMSVLQDKSFYETIISTLSNESLSYYDKIETARKELQTNSKSYSDIDSVISYNQRLYKEFVDNFFPDNTVDKKESGQYFLLQAMGLKPDDRFPNFASFIQSCGGGCGQRIASNNLVPEDIDFFKKISDADIMTIAHGHVPNCLRFPLIYKRVIEGKPLVFIENDTSNGNRPKLKSGEIDELPLSYIDELPLSYISIQEDKFLYGIGSLNESGKIENIQQPRINSAKNDYSSKNAKTFEMLALEGGPKESDGLLTNVEIDKILSFNGFKPADIVGGKRRTKKKKSNTKNKRNNIKRKSCRNKCKFH